MTNDQIPITKKNTYCSLVLGHWSLCRIHGIEDPVAGVTQAGHDELAVVEIGIDLTDVDLGAGEFALDSFHALFGRDERKQLHMRHAPIAERGECVDCRAA